MKRFTAVILVTTFMLSPVAIEVSYGEPRGVKPQPDHGVSFNDVGLEKLSGFMRGPGEGLGGSAWFDYDADGDLDLFVTNASSRPGQTNKTALFQNNGDGTVTDVAEFAGVGDTLGSSSVVTGDLDNDGYPDLFLTGSGGIMGPAQAPVRLYWNNGDGTFSAGMFADGPKTALMAAFGDINRDGLLDIFVTAPGHLPIVLPPGEQHRNALFLNNGDRTFSDISASAGIDDFKDGACVVTFTDTDRDGRLDILVGNCNDYDVNVPTPVVPSPFSLYHNNGDNTFTNIATEAGLGLTSFGLPCGPNGFGFWMGIAIADHDLDGDLDFFATSTGSFTGPCFNHALYENDGTGKFVNVAPDLGLAPLEFGWGATFGDFDADGDQDLYFAGSLPAFGAIGPVYGNPGYLFFNKGDGSYDMASQVESGGNLSGIYTSGVSAGDFDGDGFLDIHVMAAPWRGGPIPGGQPVLLHNSGNTNNTLTIRLVGTMSNHDGIGALIQVETKLNRVADRTVHVKPHVQTVETRAGSSFASSETPWPIFGLGHYDSAYVTVTWPLGLVESFDVESGQVTLVEGTGHREN